MQASLPDTAIVWCRRSLLLFLLHIRSLISVLLLAWLRLQSLAETSGITLSTVTQNVNAVVSYTRTHFSLDSLNITFALQPAEQAPSSSSVTGSLSLTAGGVTVVRRGVDFLADVGPIAGLLQTFEDMFVDALQQNYPMLYLAVQ